MNVSSNNTTVSIVQDEPYSNHVLDYQFECLSSLDPWDLIDDMSQYEHDTNRDTKRSDTLVEEYFSNITQE